MTLFVNRFWADDQVKMKSLGWAAAQSDCVPMKMETLDTESETQGSHHMRTAGTLSQAKEHPGLLANHQNPGENHGADPHSPQRASTLPTA